MYDFLTDEVGLSQQAVDLMLWRNGNNEQTYQDILFWYTGNRTFAQLFDEMQCD